MNAGIVSLEDGTPCIVYDEQLPYAISHVAFNDDGYQITLVYADADPSGPEGHTFEYPLDPPFVELLGERGNVAVAFMQNQQVIDINIYPVKFILS